MTTAHIIKSDYLGSVYNPERFAFIVKNTVQRAKEISDKIQYDAIAFTGSSGAALAYIISAQLSIPLICVRKVNDNSHYQRVYGRIEGCLSAKTYLFVDDFIGTGQTFENVVIAIEEVMPQAVCVGALLYSSSADEKTMKISVRNEYKSINIFCSYKLCNPSCVQRRLLFRGWAEKRVNI